MHTLPQTLYCWQELHSCAWEFLVPHNGVCGWENECWNYWAQLSTNNIEFKYEMFLPSHVSAASIYASPEEALVVWITSISATEIKNERKKI